MAALALTTLDPARPEVRAEARRIADRLATDPEPDSEVVQAVRSMLDNVVQGEKVTVIREDYEVTPGQAAALMGVTRQFIDRLLDDGVLEGHQRRGSKQTRIKVSEVLALAAERERERAGHDAIREAFADMGLLDNA